MKNTIVYKYLYYFFNVSLMVGLSTTTIGYTQESSVDPSPVVLPGHRYDLPATLITASEIEEQKQQMLINEDLDVPMAMVKMGGGSDIYQVGVSLVTRQKGQANTNYAVHDDVSEVYYVVEGKGRISVGGTIEDWERRPISVWNGPGSRGTISNGAIDMTIEKGDVLIIPAGTPHKWILSEELTSYVVVRGDPDAVTPLIDFDPTQFVAPEL
ncbi:MAG: cupin domain-containing protein [Gammaproteobacteria bacterium]|nr:cupin domain-containing protein [Gammaproteobacteria bacterium]